MFRTTRHPNTRRNRTLIALGALLMGTSMLGAGANDSIKTAPLEIGQPAPDFTLTDLQGNEHTLSEYTAKGQTVVLEWFSPVCPFVKKHYREDTGTMLAIQQELKDQPVVWLRINSAKASHPAADLDLNKETAKKWGITTPILLDPDGTVGRSYQAKRTPEMYIINPQGELIYHGAIDNDGRAVKPGEINYVRNALTQTLAGESITTSTTKPYGCTIKY